MKLMLAMAAVLGLFALHARAVITVVSTVENAESPTGVRAQAVIKEATGFGGGTFTAVAVKEFRALITIRDFEFNNALLVRKRQLPASDAWGLGRPLGEPARQVHCRSSR